MAVDTLSSRLYNVFSMMICDDVLSKYCDI
jgi:hypothetical protein